MRLIKNLSSERGFSLLELLIVIAIFSVMALFISFNLFGFSQTKNLTSDVQKIAFVLRAAHDNSVEQQNSNQWGVHFDNTTSTPGFFTLFNGASYATGSSTLRSQLTSGNKFLSPAAGTSTDIIFSKVYGLPSSTSSIIISSTGASAVSSTIKISAEGQIQY